MIRMNVPYEKSRNADKRTYEENEIFNGAGILNRHGLFGSLHAEVYWKGAKLRASNGAAFVSYGNAIVVNRNLLLTPKEWAHVIAHCMLHNYFGHFDRDKMPDKGLNLNAGLWNKACDIFVEQFLRDISLGKAITPDPSERYRFKLDDEQKIYDRLLERGDDGELQEFGTAGSSMQDMKGLNNPAVHKNGENPYVEQFAATLSRLAAKAVVDSGGHVWDDKNSSTVMKAARWFVSHYPLLGGVASGFKIVEDYDECMREDIQIAAVNIREGIIYANPTCGYDEEEWKFVLAHEYLHAGLQHDVRCQGRNPFIWNCAADYVVNGWLKEMGIGIEPPSLLYDERFDNMQVEAVYDILIADIRRSLRLQTFRGYGKGDLIGGLAHTFRSARESLDLDERFRKSLEQGLEYSEIDERKRGYIPAGLIQEIRALAMPPIGWKVKLAEWFEDHFPLEEKVRSYARPSRRQGSTPDIPRPGYRINDTTVNRRTFGVVVDTSGSMSAGEIGKALGAIASYAVSREVKFVRVIFCDARAYDCGYMATEDIAGRVEVKGRGGTMLQPAVDLLEKAADFPPKAPILMITDGKIENKMYIHRDHAWLLPRHCKLPFQTKKPVFQFE